MNLKAMSIKPKALMRIKIIGRAYRIYDARDFIRLLSQNLESI